MEDIEGDLMERFEKRKNNGAPARRLFALDVLRLFRPGIIKSLEGYQKLNYYGMLRHNLLVTLRNFKRYKSSFIINITGLSTGLAAVVLIYLWVNDELGIDRFHKNSDGLYQVMGHFHQPDHITTWNGMPTAMSEALLEEVPEIEYAIGATDPDWRQQYLVSTETKSIKAIGKYVGKDYFHMFSYPLVKGDVNNVLKDKGSVVISEKLAASLFGSDDPVGQSIKWEDVNISRTSIISGVFQSPPSNSTDQFEVLVPFEVYKEENGTDLVNPVAVAYVQLGEGADVTRVNEKIKDLLQKKVEGSTTELFLAKYSDNYLYGRYENGVQHGGRIEYVRLFSIIAAFILAIACVNFMNLSTARASRRMKEVGVKKSIGASRSSLVVQYLGESMLITLFALLVSFSIASLLLPGFNDMTGKQIAFHFDWQIVKASLIVWVVTGLVAGSYPALFLSGFKPALVLKGKLQGSFSETWIRRVLVVFQFSISIILILSVYVVYKQLQFVQNKSIGYENEHLIRIPSNGRITGNLDTFLSELKNISGVSNASAAVNSLYSPPGSLDFSWEGSEGVSTNFSRFLVYHDFVETLGLELREGRSFSKEFNDGALSIILNETAVKVMGLEDPLNSKAKLWGRDANIVGVVKDFHFRSFHEGMGPMFLHVFPESYMSNIVVRLEKGSEFQTVERIEDHYESFSGGFDFDYIFIDDEFRRLYESEQKVSLLSKYFAGVAIIISCLGLFGLAAFTAERKMKEIGVRKILGSGTFNIIRILTGEFTRLVLIAILIALPVGFYIVRNWLEGFAYHIEPEWWFFASAAILALLTAWMSVAWQTIKIARINPVQCLRDE